MVVASFRLNIVLSASKGFKVNNYGEMRIGFLANAG